MSERDVYEPGVPCWIETLQPDPEAAMAFYGGIFGWQFEGPGRMPGDPPGRYFVGRLPDRDVAGIGSQPVAARAPAPAWSTQICVDSAAEAADKARSVGGSVVAEPFDVPSAGRMALLADPAGAVFGVWEPGQRQGAQLVNEPGAWSMSWLDTGDPTGCAAFSSSVFGWTTETFDLGGSTIVMLRLPGYVGGEPQQPVSREVVANMALFGSDDSEDQQAGWSVDFWTGDLDALAARAAELGGTTVTAPFDISIGRTAVLADPFGAVFSVSQIGPAR